MPFYNFRVLQVTYVYHFQVLFNEKNQTGHTFYQYAKICRNMLF